MTIPRLGPGEVAGPFTIRIDPHAAFYAEARALALSRSPWWRRKLRRPRKGVLLQALKETHPRWLP